MHSREFPARLDISRISKKVRSGSEVSFCGTINARKLTDLGDLLVDLDAIIELELNIKMDEKKQIYIQGHLKADLPIRCERCLETMTYVLDKTFCLSPIEDLTQNSPYEPVVLTDGYLEVPHCVAEEILLSLPLAPKHEDANCNVACIH